MKGNPKGLKIDLIMGYWINITTDYNMYKQSFIVFAENALNDCTSYREMGRYAIRLHVRAEQLLKQASQDSVRTHEELEREIYHAGREYIHRFSSRYKPVKYSNKGVAFNQSFSFVTPTSVPAKMY